MVGNLLFWREHSGALRVTDSAGIVGRTVVASTVDGDCGVSFLHTNSNSIFWSDCGGQLWRATLQGNDPSAMSVNVRQSFDFAVDENNVYFLDLNGLMKQPLSGMTATPLATAGANYSIVPYGGDLYVTAGFLLSCPPDPKNGVYRVSIASGDTVQLVSEPNLAWELVVDASGMYWSSTKAVKKAQLDGSAVTELDPKSGSSLRLVGGRLFWNDGSSIVSVATDGTDKRVHYVSKVPRLVNGFPGMVGPALDAKRIYVWESDAADAWTFHLVSVSY